MKAKSFEEIIIRIAKLSLNNIDVVVGIATGGIVPAYLISEKLGKPLEIIWINYRSEDNRILHKKPILTKSLTDNFAGKNILLVDDRVKTGSTFDFAKKLFPKAKQVKTLAVNGKADYCLFNQDCFIFPWKLSKLEK